MGVEAAKSPPTNIDVVYSAEQMPCPVSNVSGAES